MDLDIRAVPEPAPQEGYPTCRRGRHVLTPENQGDRGRCRACHNECNRARRLGLPWDGAGNAWRRGAEKTRQGGVERRRLTPEQVRRDRLAVGACPDCGWTADVGQHWTHTGVASPDGSAHEEGPPEG